MGVNQLVYDFQVYTILNDIHEIATGNKSIAPTSTGEFTSMAQKVLATGYENTLNAISVVITKTLLAVRKYDRKFKGLEVSADRWGGYVRKLSFGDYEAVQDDTYGLEDDQDYSPFVVKKTPVVETKYIGSPVFAQHYTVFKRQLDVAMSSESEFRRFIEAMLLHASNLWEQWLENLARGAVANFIGAKLKIETDEPSGVVHLLTEYNQKSGNNWTEQDVYKADNIRPFFQFVFSRMKEISQKMSERSSLYQLKLTDIEINRHTDLRDLKVYVLADFVAQVDTLVRTNTYHEDFLKLADYEEVGYWQAITAPMSVNVVPSYIDADGVIAEDSEAVSNTKVLGVMFDRDAIGYNIAQNELDQAIYNPRNQSWSVFHHGRVQYQNDLTEKGVVFLLD